MSTCHLSFRVGEHLGFHLKTESSVKDHILSCDICANSKFNGNSFKIIKKCNSNFETKIHEALLIKKLRLNRQLFVNGSSFLLNIFYIVISGIWIVRGALAFTVIVFHWFCVLRFFDCIFKSIFNHSFYGNLVEQVW